MGSNNTNADVLSRIHVTEGYADSHDDKSGLTKEEKQVIFQEMHDKPIGGHLGMNRTYDGMNLLTTWPGMKQELEEYIRQCETCQKNKITQNTTKMPMKITTTPKVVWERCALDIVGPLIQTSDGNRYVLTFQDELSKYTLTIPIEEQDTVTVGKAFVEEVVLKFGIPQMILTDQGSNFMTKVFTNVCKLLKIKKGKCTAYHPQLKGALGRMHRVVVEYLRYFILEDQSNWDKWLPYAIFLFNMTPTTLPLDSPLMNCCLVGNVTYQEPPKTQYTYDSYIKELQSRLWSSYQTARINLMSQKECSKEYHDRNVNTPLFSAGDKVLVYDEKIR